jgi:hypothetical protein
MPAVQDIRPPRERLRAETVPDLWGRSDALFNEAGTHRYLLTRRWGQGGVTATFVMLNPSTATAREDDPTIRRCVGFARREGCNALTVVNLFGLRSTDPAVLREHPDPVGERNDEFIGQHCLPGRLVVLAWGAHGELDGRGPRVALRLAAAGVTLSCFGLTGNGQPLHPLYQAADTPLIAFGL